MQSSTQHSELSTQNSSLCEQSLKGKAWRLESANPRAVEHLMQKFELPEIIARLLVLRNIQPDDVEHFLNPTLRALLPDPFMFKDMREAAERLAAAIISGEKIAVFGDYDVDGATSSALLLRYVRALGGDIIAYIPDRVQEGYGPNTTALLGLKDQGITLVITVDCGTLAFEPLAEAHKAGLDVVVIDHHQAQAKLPDCVALVNPNRLDETGAYGELAAAGVTFLLLVATQNLLNQDGFFTTREKPDLLHYLDLVAVGTVCDVVPLAGVNRAFVAQGLKILAKCGNPGLAALLDVARINKAPDSCTIGFAIGPRINAGGRIGRASAGVELLSTNDPAVAQNIAVELDRFNAERKALESIMVEEAVAQVQAQLATAPISPEVIVVSNDAWHPGIIGIIASRLKDHFGKPAAVIALDGTGFGKASARSIPGFDFGSAVQHAVEQKILIQGGGHAMAAGFSLDANKIAALQTWFSDYFKLSYSNQNHCDYCRVEASLSVGAAHIELTKMLCRLAPFGAGNPEPLIALQHAKIVNVQVLQGGHIKLILVDAHKASDAISAIAFRAETLPMGDALRMASGKIFHFIGKLECDTWNGREKVNFIIEDCTFT